MVPAKPYRRLEVNGDQLVNLASNLATGVFGRAHVHIGLAARDKGYEIGDRLSGKLPEESRGCEGAPGHVSSERAADGGAGVEDEHSRAVTARLAHMDAGRDDIRDVTNAEHEVHAGAGGVNREGG